MTTEDRARIVQEARSWLGTPYRPNACLRGVGVDCMQLIFAVFRDCGLLDTSEPTLVEMSYVTNACQHGPDTRYIDGVEKYCRRIPENQVRSGDIGMVWVGHGFAHSILVIEDSPVRVIHATMDRGVIITDRNRHPLLRRAKTQWYELRNDVHIRS